MSNILMSWHSFVIIRTTFTHINKFAAIGQRYIFKVGLKSTQITSSIITLQKVIMDSLYSIETTV